MLLQIRNHSNVSILTIKAGLDVALFSSGSVARDAMSGWESHGSS
jgi:hypothetical protein